MAYEEFKELRRRTISNKILHNKTFNIAKYSKIREISNGTYYSGL